MGHKPMSKKLIAGYAVAFLVAAAISVVGNLYALKLGLWWLGK